MAIRVVLALHPEEHASREVVLPPSLTTRVKSDTTLTLRAGQSVASVLVKSGTDTCRPRRLHLSRDLFTDLRLTEGDTLAMWRDARLGIFRLGPVLGVMGKCSRGGLFGQSTEIIRWCVRQARRKGMLAYAFSPRDIDWTERSVRGWVWTGNLLKRVRCPLPDVVYDRVSSRTAERAPSLVRAKEQLLSCPVKYYNRSFFNKWDVHRILEKHAATKGHLPQTEELSSVEVLEKSLKRFGVVYVKPTQGSHGAGIFRVAKVRTGYNYRFTRLNLPDRRGHTRGVAPILSMASRLMKNGQYVVQRGLRLARIGGAPFDVRVLLQKSVRNKWSIQSMVARVAEPGNVVSNVADGGHILHPRRALALAFGGRINPRPTLWRLKRIARATAEAIESEVGYELAEMGVDLGIDASAKIWVIEANSRPGRETGEGRPQRISRSVQRLVSFLRSRGLQ